jgi:hypothetical protein
VQVNLVEHGDVFHTRSSCARMEVPAFSPYA